VDLFLLGREVTAACPLLEGVTVGGGSYTNYHNDNNLYKV
jgi:hypothetical protein